MCILRVFTGSKFYEFLNRECFTPNKGSAIHSLHMAMYSVMLVSVHFFPGLLYSTNPDKREGRGDMTIDRSCLLF